MPGSKNIIKEISSCITDFIARMRTSSIRERIPKPIRILIYSFLPKRSLELKTWDIEYAKVLNESKTVPLKTSVVLGITRDPMGRYGNYEAACRELGVPHKLIDIMGSDWIKEIAESGCDAFLVWPSHLTSVSKQLFDERIRVIVNEMRKIVFPSYNALFMYESKRRMSDWLEVNNIPHPQTWVFADRQEAVNFLESAKLPSVFKTDLGSAASGVEIVRSIKRARQLVDICFGKGYALRGSAWKERNKGQVIFQEYIPEAKEWRMICIGKSFFGHQKLKKGDFHSASKLVGWYEPPRKLLDFCRDIAEKGKFLSMALDVFETTDGQYLVNELQTLFGSRNPSQMYINDKPGRFIFKPESNSWHFEEGYFCRNASCNLRVEALLSLLGVILAEK